FGGRDFFAMYQSPRSKSGSLAMLGRWPKLARFCLTQAMSVGADWLSNAAPFTTIKHLGGHEGVDDSEAGNGWMHSTYSHIEFEATWPMTLPCAVAAVVGRSCG